MVKEIPLELRAFDQWVCWKYEERDGKPTKVPINAKTLRHASVTDSATYSTFSQAVQTFQSNSLSGFGFVLTEKDPFVGVDLDKCTSSGSAIITPKGYDSISPEASRIVQLLNTYTEISPSNCGLHPWVIGKLPPGPRKNGNFEMYDCDRFLCMTGNPFGSQLLPIRECQQELEQVYREFIVKQEPEFPPELQQALGEMLHVAEGGRHDYIRAMALRWARNDYPEDMTLQWCLRVAAASGLTGRRLHDVQRLVWSAYKKVTETRAGQGFYQSKQKIEEFETNKAMAWIAPRVEWLVPELIPKGQLILLAGDSQTGKTYFLTYLSYAMSIGCDFGPFFGISPTRIVYCYLEDPIQRIKERLLDFESDFGMVSNFTAVLHPNFNIAENIKDINEYCSSGKADLIILDTYQAASVGVPSKDENYHSSAFRSLARICRDSSCSIVVVDHIRKRSNQDKRYNTINLNDVLGSGKKVQNCDSIILMDREDDILNVIVHSKDVNGKRHHRLRIGNSPKYRVLT